MTEQLKMFDKILSQCSNIKASLDEAVQERLQHQDYATVSLLYHAMVQVTDLEATVEQSELKFSSEAA
jgi:hypothetical protein